MTEPAIEKRRETTRRSVTRDNAFPIDRGGGYFQILVPSVQPQAGLLPAFLPDDFRQRDRVLDGTVRADAMWSAAIGIAITKAAALAWETKSESELRSKRAQELLLAADATSISGIGGWVSYMGKQVRNFTCTNAGCFTEIIRATGAYGSRIVGLGHLSALRMRRTGDPEYPFIYIDRWGRQHVMRWWQVFNLVDMPDPDEAALGTGLCAAERAYQQIRKLAALEQYLYEKISGSRPLALHIVNGLTKDQLTDMMASASNNQASKGLSLYMGAIVATTLKPDAPPGLVTIPLAELPDGFEASQERDRADLIYANALGLDPQDLKPMSNQQMGAGSQSEVLNQKAEGRGQAAYRQQLVHMLNQLVFDDKTQFLFTERDYRDQQAAANISAARGTFVAGLVAGQIISPVQGQQILAEQGEIPKAIIEAGAQGGSNLTDTDKPDVVDPLNGTNQPQPINQPVMQPQAPAPAQAAPAAAQPVAAQPLVPVTPDGVPPTRVGAPTVKKAVLPHHTTNRSVQAGARRILRQIERKGRISTKEGVWRTIHGHPVLIGGGGGSGGSGGGGGSSSSSGASGKKAPKKGATTYVPKPSAGGSSIYPTLDAYKKGTLSHEDTLVALKADIKAAKLAGNSKAVNSLTSHYYAIKNGPHAPKKDDTDNISPATHAKLDALGKPSTTVSPDPSYSKGAVATSAHKITEAWINDEITTAQMDKQLTSLGKKTGHTPDQLKLMAKEHEQALHDAGKSTPLKDSSPVPLPDSPNAPAPKISQAHKAEVYNLAKDYDEGIVSQHTFDTQMASIARAEGVHINDLQKHLQAPGKVAPLPFTIGNAAMGGKAPPAAAFAPDAHAIMMQHVQGHLTADEMGKSMDNLSAVTGVPKADLIAAGKAHNQALNVAAGKPAQSPSKLEVIKGTPVHDAVMDIDSKIKSGNGTQADLDIAKNNIKQQLKLEHDKLAAFDSAIKSAENSGFPPSPTIAAMHAATTANIAGFEALDKHLDATVGLYGIKKATAGGIDPAHLQTALNVTSLYDKGVLKMDGYQKNMQALSQKTGIPVGKLEQAVEDHKKGGVPLGTTTLHGGVTTPGTTAPNWMNVKPSDDHLKAGQMIKEQYSNGQLTTGQYAQEMNKLGQQYGLQGQQFASHVTDYSVKHPLGMLEREIGGQTYKTTGTLETALNWGNEKYASWHAKLTQAQQKAFYGYSRHGDEPINAFLRHGKEPDPNAAHASHLPATVHKRIKDLDTALAKSSIPENVMLHRGFTHQGLADKMARGEPLTGATFRDDAYVSTSVSTSSAFGGNMQFHIAARKGQKGGFMGNKTLSYFDSEAEILLPRGSNFKIVGYKLRPGTTETWDVDVEYLGTGEVPGAFKAEG